MFGDNGAVKTNPGIKVKPRFSSESIEATAGNEFFFKQKPEIRILSIVPESVGGWPGYPTCG